MAAVNLSGDSAKINDEDIEFAFPSCKVYQADDDKRQIKLKMPAGETKTYTPERNKHECRKCSGMRLFV
jgi:hypothetical protein